MLRRRIQRASCAANTLAYALLLAVVCIHVLHRKSTPNVSGHDSGVQFWFEASDDEDDQPQHHRAFIVNLRVVFGVLGAFFVAALCDAGGIAGAGLFVPLFCLVVGFGLKAATGLSQAAIAGVSLASLAFNLFRTHPWDPSKPLVDLDLALMLTPTSLLGVSVGVLLNDLLPNWFIMSLLVVLLLYVCHRNTILGLTTWHEENQHQTALQAAAAISSGPMPQLRRICTVSSSAESSPRQLLHQPACGSPGAAGDETAVPGAAAMAGVAEAGRVTAGAAAGASTAATAGVFAYNASAAAEDTSSANGSPALYQESTHCEQQQQQQQHTSTEHRVFDEGSDLHAPLLDGNSDYSPSSHARHTANVAATANNPSGSACTNTSIGCSSSSSSNRSRTLPVPFMSCVKVPLPPLSGRQGSCSPPAVLNSHVVSFSAFPWIKFFSVVMLWFGFLGLTALDTLIPLCSWYYVTYMLLFLALTIFVTFVFVKMILMDPLSAAAAAAVAASSSVGGVYSLMEQGGVSSSGSRKAAGQHRHSSSQQHSWGASGRSFRQHLVTWLNVLSGTELTAEPSVAAAAAQQQCSATSAAEGQQPEQRMSLFMQEQLRTQQQIRQPFLHQQTSFSGVAAAAAAAAAAAGAERSTTIEAVEQQMGLVHVAAAAAAVAGAAGVASGVCGLAGGALLYPILLDFRVHPQVATATSVLLVFMSSSAAVLSFVIEGRLVGSYALLFAGVAMAGACAGVWLIGSLVRQTCRASVVILVLAALTGLAGAFSAVSGGQEFLVDWEEHEGLGFRALCAYS